MYYDDDWVGEFLTSDIYIVESFVGMFLGSDPKTQQCPYLGHYDVVSIWKSALNRAHVLEHGRGSFEDNVAELRERTSASTSSPKHCHHSRVSRLDIGCGSPDRMKFLTSSCKDETFSGELETGNSITCRLVESINCRFSEEISHPLSCHQTKKPISLFVLNCEN